MQKNSSRVVRIGNDINLRWDILTNGQADSLEGRNLTLELWHTNGHRVLTDYTVTGNTLIWTFPGRDQRWTGSYLLTLTENKGMAGMATIDTKAFVLVARMFGTNGLTEPNNLQLSTGNLSIEAGGYPLASAENNGLMSSGDKRWSDQLAELPALTPEDAADMTRKIIDNTNQ